MSADRIQKIKERAMKATQGNWGPYDANLPFYAIVKKPAPSLSKHDLDQPSIWRVDDAIFVSCAVEDVKFLLSEIERLQTELNRELR